MANILKLNHFVIKQVAKTCHEVNRAYSAINGDMSHKPWDETPDNIQASAINGVHKILDGSVTTPEQAHESWMRFKTEDGWVYGEEKNLDNKTHPCMRPYNELPEDQQHKDALFFSVVLSFL